MPGTTCSPPTRRTFALFVLGVVAFTVYGSLVPFEFRSRAVGEAADSFLWAMTRRAVPQSRSDALANVLLGVPLGFGLLGLARLDRPGKARAAFTGVLLLPACLAFAAAVEFAQLFVPARTCAGSDVLCQVFGAVIGMAGWVLFGQRLTEQARQVVGAGAAGRLLVAYLALLAFVQALPMDLTLSPRDVYNTLRDRVVYVPFSEFRGASAGRVWERTATLVQVAALYLPAGLLAASVPGGFRSGVRVLALAVGLACGMEAIQLVVLSRTPSATDVVVGATAATLGWAVGRCFPSFAGWESRREARRAGGVSPPSDAGAAGRADVPRGADAPRSPRSLEPLGAERRRRPGLSLEAALVLGQLWLAAVAVVCWQPFDFAGTGRPFDWLLGLPREYKSDLYALEEMITKMVLFAPFGVLAAVALSRGRLLIAAAIGAVVAFVFEIGQKFLPGHVPGVTDVILGAVGAWAGVWMTTKVRGEGVA